MRVVRLQHTLVEEVVPHVEDILGPRVCVGRGASPPPEGPSETNELPKRLLVAAHPGTNSILLHGTVEEVDEAVELIGMLDVPAAAGR